MELKKIITRKSISNIVLVVFILLVLFVPATKALMIRGLMSIGLFKPDTEVKQLPVTDAADLSGIQFKDSSGNTLDLGDLKGKVVFLNFWATWCPPCIAEMPSIHKLYEQFKDNKEVVFVMVDADSDFPKAQKFLDKKGYKLPVYAVASNIPKSIFAGSLPTTVVFDKMGRVAYNEVGAADYANEKFVEFLKKLTVLKI